MFDRAKDQEPWRQSHIGGRLEWAVAVDHGEDGEKEGSRLPRASLGTRHQVSLAHDDRQSVLLDCSGVLVLRHLGRGKGENLTLEIANGNTSLKYAASPKRLGEALSALSVRGFYTTCSVAVELCPLSLDRTW